MEPQNESPGALAGAAEAETETAKFQNEYTGSGEFRQARPRHIADIAAKIFLDTCEQQILRQIEKLPAEGGGWLHLDKCYDGYFKFRQ